MLLNFNRIQKLPYLSKCTPKCRELKFKDILSKLALVHKHNRKLSYCAQRSIFSVTELPISLSEFIKAFNLKVNSNTTNCDLLSEHIKVN